MSMHVVCVCVCACACVCVRCVVRGSIKAAAVNDSLG